MLHAASPISVFRWSGRSLAALKEAGFLLIVVTNRPDVGNGLVARAVVEAMHRRLNELLPVDAIEVCYHRQSDYCECREPKPGMLRCAAERLSVECASSFMIGDRASDVEAGRRMGCGTVFIDLGYIDEHPVAADFVVSSIGEAARLILGQAWGERPNRVAGGCAACHKCCGVGEGD